ncbi:MAG TPA: FeoB-associated Cys-rich membrane protein [Pyrinomonadaceae bacterium]|nr:FeoB-associated Cys-rich membrane protein [Pyrinomonadaceae bacterium]
MFVDWQTIAVWLIILAALLYVGRRALTRVRSFRAGGKKSLSACASGCGSCGEEQTAAPTRPQNVLVQIKTTGRQQRS